MGCVSMDIAPLYQTTLGESAVGVWAQGFFVGMGHMVQAGSLKWSCQELVCE
jgi:hypothetical protein